MTDSLKWTTKDMPDLTGRLAIVTGANSGLGLETTRALAAHGAAVTMAVRDLAKGEQARSGLNGDVRVMRLDLADLASVREFAQEWSTANPQGVDLLINNAGVMAIPRRASADGYEMQFATNHLGHFALTGLLLPALLARPRSRVVNVSSNAHKFGRMRFDDLMGERKYSPWSAYGQSKLANLLFTAELQRRLDANGSSTLAMAAHPGLSETNLAAAGPTMTGNAMMLKVSHLSGRLLAQSAAMGALPTLFAATAPGLPGNSYVGPDGFLEQRGHPRLVGRTSHARDQTQARRLWDASEGLTGVRYPID